MILFFHSFRLTPSSSPPPTSSRRSAPLLSPLPISAPRSFPPCHAHTCYVSATYPSASSCSTLMPPSCFLLLLLQLCFLLLRALHPTLLSYHVLFPSLRFILMQASVPSQLVPSFCCFVLFLPHPTLHTSPEISHPIMSYKGFFLCFIQPHQ